MAGRCAGLPSPRRPQKQVSQRFSSDLVVTYEALEIKLAFQKAIDRLAVLTAIRAVDAIVAAHHRSDASVYSVLERPQVHFMHCLIVDVGRAAENVAIADRVAVRFLFLQVVRVDQSRAPQNPISHLQQSA